MSSIVQPLLSCQAQSVNSEGPKLIRGTDMRYNATRQNPRDMIRVEPHIAKTAVEHNRRTEINGTRNQYSTRNGQTLAPIYIFEGGTSPPPPPPTPTVTIVGFVFLLWINHLTRSREATESSTDECPFEPPPAWIDLPRFSFVLS